MVELAIAQLAIRKQFLAVLVCIPLKIVADNGYLLKVSGIGAFDQAFDG